MERRGCAGSLHGGRARPRPDVQHRHSPCRARPAAAGARLGRVDRHSGGGFPRRGSPPRDQLREGRGGGPRHRRIRPYRFVRGLCHADLPMPASPIRGSGISGSRSRSSTSSPTRRRSARSSNARARPEAMPAPLLVGRSSSASSTSPPIRFPTAAAFSTPAAAIAQARHLAAERRRHRRARRRGQQCRGRPGTAGRGNPPPRSGDRRACRKSATPLAIDTFRPEVQLYALARGVDYLNDIQGFPDPAICIPTWPRGHAIWW